MGMYCSLHRATAAEIERLIAHPDEVQEFLFPDDGTVPPLREVRPKGVLGFLLRLLPVTVSEVDPDWRPPENPAAPARDPDAVLDIEKDWYGLQFLFTGTESGGEEPACYMVEGGEPLDDEGFARALRPQQARRFADFLSGLSRDELVRRYDPTRADAPLDDLLASFTNVKEFVRAAASRGDGVIIHIA
jgi:hypothetical protein